MHKRNTIVRAGFVLAGFVLTGLATMLPCLPALAQQTPMAETPAEMLAAQVRIQGIPCGKALAARRDAKRSKPDHAVWVLKCSNATYRVGRSPDMAAKVVRLK